MAALLTKFLKQVIVGKKGKISKAENKKGKAAKKAESRAAK